MFPSWHGLNVSSEAGDLGYWTYFPDAEACRSAFVQKASRSPGRSSSIPKQLRPMEATFIRVIRDTRVHGTSQRSSQKFWPAN